MGKGLKPPSFRARKGVPKLPNIDTDIDMEECCSAREKQKRTILAGLRALKAPAVAWSVLKQFWCILVELVDHSLKQYTGGNSCLDVETLEEGRVPEFEALSHKTSFWKAVVLNTFQFKVIGLLVTLLFAQKSLPFDPVEHVECFAGARSVTFGELEDSVPHQPRLLILDICLGIKRLRKESLVDEKGWAQDGCQFMTSIWFGIHFWFGIGCSMF